MSKEIRETIKEICKEIPFTVIYLGKHKSDNWDCDAFTLVFGGQSFEYYQGLGNSIRIFNPTAKPFEEKLAGKRFCIAAKKEGYEIITENWQNVLVPRFIKKPCLADFLYIFLLDANMASEPFGDFCANGGYDEDSRKALETYLKCQENGSKLYKVLSFDKREKCSELLADY